MKRKVILTGLILSLLLVTACGGRNPEPIMVKRLNDEKKNCKLLTYEIENLEFEIHQLLPKTDKLKQNVAYGVAGWFFLYVPWLLMDFKNAEATEYEALAARHTHLASLAKNKGCKILPKDYPSLDRVKEEYDVYKRLQPNYRVTEKSLDPEVLENLEKSPLEKLTDKTSAITKSAKENVGKVTDEAAESIVAKPITTINE